MKIRNARKLLHNLQISSDIHNNFRIHKLNGSSEFQWKDYRRGIEQPNSAKKKKKEQAISPTSLKWNIKLSILTFILFLIK